MNEAPPTKKSRITLSSSSTQGTATGPLRTIISRGAEGKIETLTFLGFPAVVKTREPKLYRIPQLERMITRERTVGEARCLRKCWTLGIRVPLIYCVNLTSGMIVMERLKGPTVKTHLLKLCGPEDHEAVARLVGEAIAKLHENNIVHGDLTTSNMIIESAVELEKAASGHAESSGSGSSDGGGDSRLKKRSLALIDFGLGTCNAPPQAMAVDLYVLQRAFLSTHPEATEMFDRVLAFYQAARKNPKPVMEKLKAVQARGRKRLAFG